ncbi:hypothetical protein DKG77_15110 [Flagellimonas aquimarina]|uniref:Uncharacterized protein n=2 Tax=Flagellimonas aquimarina TaxID=2201895 RepID=A0A316KVJ7_9FLAO|nr:hypothetical protein DKG77_15110 [Allomuricauda koreensis]
MLAQNSKKSAEEISNNGESYILTDVSYINDAIFMGRRDSIAAPYIFPSIGYYDKSGFFVDASASYLVGSEENRVDLVLANLGYLTQGEKLGGGISGTAYFFNEDSYNVQSEIIADISGFLSYNFKVLEISLMASTYFNDGSSADIFTGLMLDRIFYSNDQNFLIDPTISIYGGSQYFYQEYYLTSRLGNRKGQGQGQGTGGTNTAATMVEIEEASEFNILNVELSLPVQYHHKQFIFSFAPTLALPQSSATITTEDSVITEDLESVFYFSAGISYWFNTKKREQ